MKGRRTLKAVAGELGGPDYAGSPSSPSRSLRLERRVPAYQKSSIPTLERLWTEAGELDGITIAAIFAVAALVGILIGIAAGFCLKKCIQWRKAVRAQKAQARFMKQVRESGCRGWALLLAFLCRQNRLFIWNSGTGLQAQRGQGAKKKGGKK